MTSIAILGASSQIARDLIVSMVDSGRSGIQLYVRDLIKTKNWVEENRFEKSCEIFSYESYGKIDHEVVLNFVGVGDPQRAAKIGTSIFDITNYYDELVLKNLVDNPSRRYIFISSGAVYGKNFQEPVTANSSAIFSINNLRPEDWYGIAKLYAESKHRTRPELAIVDLRIFNYFSNSQDLGTRFFITDVINSIWKDQVLKVSADNIVRDYLHPSDFKNLVDNIINSPPLNIALDCYSREPVDKFTLLNELSKIFNLRFKVDINSENFIVNATGTKSSYYSSNRKAKEIGYDPKYSSLEGVVKETSLLLSKLKN
jgi:nucleoside-diphosphate-sugar epimerase